MFSWIFKKPGASVAPPRPAAAPRTPTRPSPAAPAPQAARERPGAAEDWAARLRDAEGDAALLQLAQAAGAPLQTKLAAIEALAGEDALKQAERAFRSHDRKVHRLAKQRLETAVLQRQSRLAAQGLVERATVFLDQAGLAMNHVAELDREWAALPQALLAPGQAEQFDALRTQLAEQIRAHGEAELQARRAALQAVQAAQAAQAQAAAEAAAAAQAAAAESAAAAADAAAVAAAASTAANADDTLAPPAKAPLLGDAQRERLDQALGEAEAALAAGRLVPLRKQQQRVEALLDEFSSFRLPGPLRQRWQALRAEAGRLQSWQHWGGTRARKDLVAQAEALARQIAPTPPAVPSPPAGGPDTTAAAPELVSATALPDSASAAATPEGDAATAAIALPPPRPARAAPRLNLKAHADSLQSLRQRWKELDRLGAAAPALLWQRFDAACKAAYGPVAAQAAVLKAARQDNLLKRQHLLATLEQLPVAEDPADAPAGSGRDIAQALDRFWQAWRKLGPIEHTAPADSREALAQRLAAAVARLELPLQAVLAAATAERERLIARAQALTAAPAGSGGRGGVAAADAAPQVRDLQAQWQQQARQMPLPRGLEQTLWKRFAEATDAVFAQRQAEFAARDAELAANLAACEALLARLEALGPATPLAEVEQVIAETDRSWRAGGPLPRGALAQVEARHAQAHQAAQGLLAAARRARWQAQCDALSQALAGGDARSDGTPAALPAVWAQALAQSQARTAPGPLPADALDDLLLQLETALELPAPPERQEQRRQLKLRALKQALEGRGPTPAAANTPREWLLAALRQPGLSPDQQQRLQAVVAALRAAPSGALVLPTAGA